MTNTFSIFIEGHLKMDFNEKIFLKLIEVYSLVTFNEILIFTVSKVAMKVATWPENGHHYQHRTL